MSVSNEAFQVTLDAKNAEIKRLRAALSELTSACEVEFTGENTDDDDDDEPVGGGLKEDSSPDPMIITFGMIRRARAALDQ